MGKHSQLLGGSENEASISKFCLCVPVVGYPGADSTSILSQKRQMIIRAPDTTSMTSRNLAPFTTGKQPRRLCNRPPWTSPQQAACNTNTPCHGVSVWLAIGSVDPTYLHCISGNVFTLT